jgi:predicted GH43/DUF377 family glycosyl hydrolase
MTRFPLIISQNEDSLKKSILVGSLLIASCFSHALFAEEGRLLDLQTLRQDFVLETKQIKIPEFPLSFNPSIIRWRGSLLLVFRTRDAEGLVTNKIGLVQLDENFDPIGLPTILRMELKEPFTFSQEQDPRIIGVGQKLYLVFNNVWEKKTGVGRGPFGSDIRRMLTSEIKKDDEGFFLENPEWLLDFDVQNINRTEKNWVPFVYDDQLMLSYSIKPHRVFRPIFGTNSCETYSLSTNEAHWNWGVLRGGTQGLLVGDEYLSFFHTCKDLQTVQSEGKRMVHYFMGAYTFSPAPPFAITRMSPEPIVGEDFYTGPSYKTWKPMRVVFPCGFIADEKYIYVVYGKQDHEMWVVKLDKENLLGSLIKLSN